jgi:hypothetical protein
MVPDDEWRTPTLMAWSAKTNVGAENQERIARQTTMRQALAEILEYKLNLLELEIFPKTFWVHLIDEIPSIE